MTIRLAMPDEWRCGVPPLAMLNPGPVCPRCAANVPRLATMARATVRAH